MQNKPGKAKRLLHHLMAFDRRDQPVQIEEVPISLSYLPSAFCGARIAVVADVHFPDSLLSVSALTRVVASQNPDAVFLLGDLTNSYTFFDKEKLVQLAAALSRIAPCFAVPGNHELRLGREKEYGNLLTEHGVHYLCDNYADWNKGGDTLRLYGMGYRRPAPLAVSDQPSIVLAHKPDRFPYYQRARWELVVCGHAHGGQVRVGNRALYAPGQGFFPTYTGGVYTGDNTVMVVSRGLGNSSIPWRIQNAPHLPIIVLQPK